MQPPVQPVARNPATPLHAGEVVGATVAQFAVRRCNCATNRRSPNVFLHAGFGIRPGSL